MADSHVPSQEPYLTRNVHCDAGKVRSESCFLKANGQKSNSKSRAAAKDADTAGWPDCTYSAASELLMHAMALLIDVAQHLHESHAADYLICTLTASVIDKKRQRDADLCSEAA